MTKVLVATGNRGKLDEIKQVLADLPYTFVAQAEFKLPPVEESGLTFIENAIIKARHAAAFTGLPSIADDSGIAVDALNGAPGIYSARYAGEHGDDEANNALLLERLKRVPAAQRTCRFQCAIVAMRHPADSMPLVATGTWQGTVTEEPRGTNGFGYDPLFQIEGRSETSAEISSDEKNQISHRAIALAKFREQLATIPNWADVRRR